MAKNYFVKLMIFITILSMFLTPYLSSNTNAYIIRNSNNNIEYNEIFDSKELIRIEPLHNFKTLLLNQIFSFWLKQNEIFQSLTTPKIDDNESSIFSYWAKPCYQIGLPDQHFATMITPEGHLYTGSAELEFFAGENLTPVNQRIWVLSKGYLPCINYEIQIDGLIYKIQAFQYWIDHEYSPNAVNFIKVQISNPGIYSKKGNLAVGFEYGGRDHRPFEMVISHPFNPLWMYKMDEDYASRGNKIVYLWDDMPSEKLQDLEKEYEKQFCCLNMLKTVCVSSYSEEIGGGESKNFTFKMPQSPIDESNETLVSILKNADYNEYFNKMEFFWDSLIENRTKIMVCEDKIMNASKSYFILNLMFQNNVSDDEIEQVCNRFQYNQLWTNGVSYTSIMYNFYNFFDYSEKTLRHIESDQEDIGNMISQPGYFHQMGSALYGFGEYIKMSDDKEFAEEIFEDAKKGVEWIKEQIISDKYGLLPYSNNKDAAMVAGRSTGDNLWTLMGLNASITIAKAAGEEEAAQDFKNFHDAFKKHFIKQLRITSERNGGIIPPAMDAYGGIHWQDLIAGCYSNLLDPFDPLINATYEHYKAEHMIEGIATYKSSLHGAHTYNVVLLALRRGEQEDALHGFYSMLLHTGSCHEGFEYCVFPSTRDYSTRASLPMCIILKTQPYWCNFPSNGGFAGDINKLLRMMFIREENNVLHLFSAVSPEWFKPGNTIEILNAPTYFGNLNLTANVTETGINISFNPTFKKTPESIVVHIPFFVNVSSVYINQTLYNLENNMIYLHGEKCRIEISCEINSEISYSYEAFVEEYTSR